MKVILLQDVKKLGKVGDLVEVADGYGRNFLIPKGMAILADEGKLKAIQEKVRVEKRRRDKELREAEEAAKSLGTSAVTLQVKTGEQGRLYGSITAKDVADAIERELGISVDKKKIEISEPIKSLGTYRIPVKLFPGISSEITVNVVSAEQPT